MCGRYGLQTPVDELARRLNAELALADPGPRYNAAPTQTLPVARQPEPGRRELIRMEWGLVPFWAKDPQETRSKYSLINARAESVADKPAFKAAFRRRRALIPADGFYEWQEQGGDRPKQPYWIRLRSGEPMFFAGLWEGWEGEINGEPKVIESYCIIVGEPNELLASIHNRMPVVLGPADWGLWLDPEVRDPQPLSSLLAPYPAEAMEAVRVSRRVNSPANDDPGLIEAMA
ncbi:SOS response-associated peptidase [Thiohalorhabdus sp.]|uniref:SOS response-associated peptidase n=1 Tax=Thiohalorhabdus sp. TaxID=3094134 RepID=UPI002FC2F65B